MVAIWPLRAGRPEGGEGPHEGRVHDPGGRRPLHQRCPRQRRAAV